MSPPLSSASEARPADSEPRALFHRAPGAVAAASSFAVLVLDQSLALFHRSLRLLLGVLPLRLLMLLLLLLVVVLHEGLELRLALVEVVGGGGNLLKS